MNDDSDFKRNKKILIIIMAILLLIIITLGATFAFFNYTRTGPVNTIETGYIDFDYTNNANINLSNQAPTSELNITNDNKMTFSITSYTTLPAGVTYNIYAVYGDEETGKTRLLDNVVKFKFAESNSVTGITNLTNNYQTASNLTFINGKALIATGKVQGTSQSVTKNYEAYLWVDEDAVFVSSTTKRATLPEGNPSMAVSTEGNVTAARYIKNNNTLENVTLFPALQEAQGKIIYTTNEYTNSYYSIKILVEVNE